LSSGHRLSWPPAADEDEKGDSIKGRTTTNVLFVPKGKTIVVLSYVKNKTVCRDPRILQGAYVHIYRCQQSYIYLLSAMKCVTVYKCRDCTIVLGPTALCVRVIMCKNVRVISVTRQIWISDTAQSQFFLLIATRPVFAGNRNDTISIAPYHTHYAQLAEQMREAGIGPTLNLWDYPLCLASDCSIESAKYWKQLHPAEFFLFNIPFETPGTAIVPNQMLNELPSVYRNALIIREKMMASWQHTVATSNLTEQQRIQLDEATNARFQEWLRASGHQHELDSLCALARYLQLYHS